MERKKYLGHTHQITAWEFLQHLPYSFTCIEWPIPVFWLQSIEKALPGTLCFGTSMILALKGVGWQGSQCTRVAFGSKKYQGCCSCNLGRCPKIFLVRNSPVKLVKFYSVTDCIFEKSKSLATDLSHLMLHYFFPKD